MLRITKSFEGNGAFVILRLGTQFHLVVDARPQSFGVRVEAERSEDLKVGGAMVNLLRKHARTAGLGTVTRDPATSSFWLPLFTGGDQPTWWLELAKSSPPELRFLDAQGTIHIRKSVQGTYTKRRQAETLPPAYPLPPSFEDVTPKAPSVEEEKTPEAGEAAAPGQELLPDYQRSARDRVSRRLKTARKALEKARSQLLTPHAIEAMERRAGVLQSRLHEIKPEQFELLVEGEESIPVDPERSPGANLQTAFENVKKAKRSLTSLAAHVTKSTAELDDMAKDLERLRGAELAKAAVEGILKKYKLAAERQAVRRDKNEDLSGKPYRVIRLPAEKPGGKATELLVGKSAADNDELCKMAKGNDYWLHAIGVTGSHVIIPARQLKGAPDASLLRAGAILALHFSKLRTDLKGEVYCTMRQHIRKRKGMAPGLWSVEKAETLFCKYDEAELAKLLGHAES